MGRVRGKGKVAASANRPYCQRLCIVLFSATAQIWKPDSTSPPLERTAAYNAPSEYAKRTVTSFTITWIECERSSIRSAIYFFVPRQSNHLSVCSHDLRPSSGRQSKGTCTFAGTFTASASDPGTGARLSCKETDVGVDGLNSVS